MAAGALPRPGSAIGPCVDACQHTDCAQTRAMAASACVVCGEPIGYDQPFYQRNDWHQLVHAVCEEDQL